MKRNKKVFIWVIVVVVVTAIYYQYFLGKVPTNLYEGFQVANRNGNFISGKEVSTTATYTTPDGKDTVRFTIALDRQGYVIGVKTTDVLKGEAISTNLEKFSTNLLVMLKGKKLSDINNVSRVGTSSLTTTAFNSVLGNLKAQI
jgi:hypothetical protein